MQLEQEAIAVLLGALAGVAATLLVGVFNNVFGWFRMSKQLNAQGVLAEANRVAAENRISRQLQQQREDIILQLEAQQESLLKERQVQAIATVTGILQLQLERAKDAIVRAVPTPDDDREKREPQSELYRDFRQHSIILPAELESLALLAWHTTDEYKNQVLSEIAAGIVWERYNKLTREQKVEEGLKLAEQLRQLPGLAAKKEKAADAEEAFEDAAKAFALGK